MNSADRVNETAALTTTSTITLTGTAVSSFRTFAAAIAATDNPLAVGTKGVGVGIVDRASGKWLDGYFTLTSSTLLTRDSIVASSANGADVDFGGASCEVYVTVFAADLLRIPRDRDVLFSQSVPLDQVGITWMAPQTVSSKYTFTPAAGAVKGATTTGYLQADGVAANAPDVSAFKSPVGSASYNNVAGAMNQWEASFDGVNKWWTWSQEGSTSSGGGGDTTLPVMSGSLASSNITSSGYRLTWAGATDNSGTVASYELSTNGGASYTNIGNVLVYDVSGLVANTAYQNSLRAIDPSGNRASPALTLTVTTLASSDTALPTMNGAITASNVTQTGYTLSWLAGSDNVGVVGYERSLDGGATYADVGNVLSVTISGRTPGAVDQVRVRDYDAAGLRGAPLSASVTLLAATVPSAPTIGAATAGDASISVTWTLPTSNGGSALTGQTINVYNAGTNAFITSANVAANATSGSVGSITNGVSVYAKVLATNGVGPSTESAASNNVTPAAAADWPRVRSSDMSTGLHESGTGPYTYQGTTGTTVTTEAGGLLTKSIPANSDGYVEFTVPSLGDGGVRIGMRTINSPSTNSGAYLYTSGTSPYYYRQGGGANIQAGAATDTIRYGRFSGVVKAQVKLSGPSTWTDLFSNTSLSATAQMWIDVQPFGTCQMTLQAQSGLT